MIISVRCPQCGWRGYAVVGDFSKSDYECPKCGCGSLKRPRRGTPAGNIARLKVKKLERKKGGREEDEVGSTSKEVTQEP